MEVYRWYLIYACYAVYIFLISNKYATIYLCLSVHTVFS